MRPTDDTPITFRNNPDPKDKAKASKIPIPTANTRAVDTEGSCCLPDTPSKGFPLVLSSGQPLSVQIQSGTLDEYVDARVMLFVTTGDQHQIHYLLTWQLVIGN